MASTSAHVLSSDLPTDSFSILNDIAPVSLDFNDEDDAMDDLHFISHTLPCFSVSNSTQVINLSKANVLLFLKSLIEIASKSDLKNTHIGLLESFPFLQHSLAHDESAFFSQGTESKASASQGASFKALRGNRKRPAHDDSDLKKVSPFAMRITRSQYHKGYVRRRSLDEIKSASASASAGQSSSNNSIRAQPLESDFQYCDTCEYLQIERPLAGLSAALFGTVPTEVLTNYELLLTERWSRVASESSTESNADASSTLPAAGEPSVCTCLLVHWESSLSQFLHNLLAEGAQVALGDLLLRALVHLAGEPYRRRAIEHLRPRALQTVTNAKEETQRVLGFDAEPEPSVELCTCVRFGNGSPHSAREQYEHFLALYVELFELLESLQPCLFQIQTLEQSQQQQYSLQHLIHCLTASLAYVESLHHIRLLTSPNNASSMYPNILLYSYIIYNFCTCYVKCLSFFLCLLTFYSNIFPCDIFICFFAFKFESPEFFILLMVILMRNTVCECEFNDFLRREHMYHVKPNLIDLSLVTY